MYALISNEIVVEYPYSIEALRAANRNVSFPSDMPNSMLAERGVYPVTPTSKPAVNKLTHKVVEATPIYNSAVGRWEQAWNAVVLTTEETGIAKAEFIAEVTEAVQQRLDDFASTRGYGDSRTSPIVSACSYASSNHPRYGVEGTYCLTKRAQTWDMLYSIMASVERAERPVPTLEQVLAELPVLAWPV